MDQVSRAGDPERASLSSSNQLRLKTDARLRGHQRSPVSINNISSSSFTQFCANSPILQSNHISSFSFTQFYQLQVSWIVKAVLWIILSTHQLSQHVLSGMDEKTDYSNKIFYIKLSKDGNEKPFVDGDMTGCCVRRWLVIVNWCLMANREVGRSRLIVDFPCFKLSDSGNSPD